MKVIEIRACPNIRVESLNTTYLIRIIIIAASLIVKPIKDRSFEDFILYIWIV